MKENKKRLVVAVLGHVDHGKTTLLDAIRGTKVVAGESGGITQNIGISSIETKEGRKITFIDTPGHAAFSQMRSQGAKVADIAVLVVAADDAVMPQTKEAIEYIKKEKIPFVVAVTKKDLPGANLEATKGSLEKEEVFLEGRGGDVPLVLVSGKTGEGINELLEVISLLAEVNETKESTGEPLYAVVIETGKDKRGILVTLVVKSGLLKVGDMVYTQGKSAKIRGIFNTIGKPVKEVLAGEAALVLGFSDTPQVGAKIYAKDKGSGSREEKKIAGENIKDGKPCVLIKTKNQGALDAIISGLNKEVRVLAGGIGEVTEGDIFLAKPAGAFVLSFESKASNSVKKLADTEGVIIKTFDVIYDLFDFVDELKDASDEKVKGQAVIMKAFSHQGTKKIAGCKMLEGTISKKDTLKIRRGEKELGEVRAISMKKGKEEVEEVKTGEEFGSLKSQIDSAKEVLILLPTTPKLDEVAAGLGLYLSLSKSKAAFISCPTAMTVEFNRLVGVNKIKSELGNKNLTIRLVDYPAKNIEKVSYDIVNDEFRLLVVPKDSINPPGSDQVHMSYSGVSADTVIIIGGAKEGDFPAILSDEFEKAKKIHLGISALEVNAELGVLSFARPASSICELIADLIKESDHEIDADIATNLFAGLQKVTGNLVNQEITADTLELAAYLIRSGAKRELPVAQPTGGLPLTPGAFPRQFPGLGKVRDIDQVENTFAKEPTAPQDWVKPPKIYRGSRDSSIS
jgi:translation initiation factor IF-2